MKTYVINVIGGPGTGKTTCCALLFAKLKIMGYTVEYVQEVAKGLVWAEDYDLLDNQYWVSQKQYKSMECMQDKVNFIITDGCLLHGIYYNRFNKHNVSNVDKTEKFIWSCYNQFNNINIFMKRGDFQYETAGRQQTEVEALAIDDFFLEFLEEHQIPYEAHLVEKKGQDYSVDAIVDYIMRCLEQSRQELSA